MVVILTSVVVSWVVLMVCLLILLSNSSVICSGVVLAMTELYEFVLVSTSQWSVLSFRFGWSQMTYHRLPMMSALMLLVMMHVVVALV